VAKRTVHIANVGDLYIDPGVHPVHLLGIFFIILKTDPPDNPDKRKLVVSNYWLKKESGNATMQLE
jgi:hypothetical protein